MPARSAAKLIAAAAAFWRASALLPTPVAEEGPMEPKADSGVQTQSEAGSASEPPSDMDQYCADNPRPVL